MANKFDYENMLNTIVSKKLTKNTNLGMFTDDEMEAWNSAIDLCYGVVKRRQSKFDMSESNCTLADVSVAKRTVSMEELMVYYGQSKHIFSDSVEQIISDMLTER